MCNFLSVLILRNGDIRHHPLLDSHADLVAYFNIPDATPFLDRFAKAELMPKNWLDPATWEWRIDEAVRPQWLDDVEAGAEAATRALAKTMILTDACPRLIVDGVWILGGTAVLRDVRGGRILRVQDSARVNGVGGSARVSSVWGSAQVNDVWGSAQVNGVGGSARVSGVRDSARVSDVWGSAQVSDVGPNVVLDDSARAHLITAMATP